MTRIFISYSSQDAAFADTYYRILLQRDHEVWMDRAELKGGQEWVHIIQDRIRWSDAMIVLWSANALRSTWVEMEMTYAHTLKKKIIPVLIDDTSPQEHMIINARQVIDARGAAAEIIVNQIEESIAGDNRRPITTRSAPVAADVSVSGQPDRPRRTLARALASGLALLLVGGALALALARGDADLTVTPTLAETALPTVPLATLAPEMLAQPVTLELLNAWRGSRGLPALNVHPALQTAAEQHVSYLRSLPLPELESTNVFRSAEGQDVVYMAHEAGYPGSDVIMQVQITDGDYTLADLIADLENPQQYSDVGLEQVRSIATGKLYVVLILGTSS
jgi:hypothetical protein